ncbi:MAG: xanthine phosphoribosyltransferase [Acidimicrobiia bacterium]|nr:xanthine phosphoribosyltransferase [Acidimicrobiia bacterium]
MSLLLDAIRTESRVTDGLLKVDRFLNHRVRPDVLREVGAGIGALIEGWGADVLLTAEASGIPPALAASLETGLPTVYAKKFVGPGRRRSFGREVSSPTKGFEYRVEVARHVLDPGQRVVVVDDFLSGGRTAVALVEIAREAGAEVLGGTFVIEKAWMPGRGRLESIGCEAHSLVSIASVDGGDVVFTDA